MYFKTTNYGIKDSSIEKFKEILEIENTTIGLASNDNGIWYALEGEIFIYRYLKKTSKKCGRLTSKITAIFPSNGFVVCGAESGEIRIFMESTRKSIKQYNDHEARVNDIKLYNENQIVSCSDDLTIKFYSFTEPKAIYTIDRHNDFIKCLEIINNVVYAGSSDGWIYGYSLESYERVFIYKAGEPIKKLAHLNEEKLIYVTGNSIVILNLKTGERVNSKPIHTKEIQQMKVYKGRLYTASLDASFKIWSEDIVLISYIRFECGIINFDITSDIPIILLENNKILRLEKPKEDVKKYELKPLRSKFEDEVEDFKLLPNPIEKYNKLEYLIKGHNYKKAVFTAIESKDIQKIFSVLAYVKQVNKLTNVVEGLDLKGISDLLDMIIDNITQVELIDIYCELIDILVRLFWREILYYEDLYEKLEFLSYSIDEEAVAQEKIIETISFLECFQNV